MLIWFKYPDYLLILLFIYLPIIIIISDPIICG